MQSFMIEDNAIKNKNNLVEAKLSYAVIIKLSNKF